MLRNTNLKSRRGESNPQLHAYKACTTTKLSYSGKRRKSNMNKCTDKETWQRAHKKSKQTQKQQATQRRKEYNRLPSLCKHCNKVLPYLKRNGLFCNRSCSASYNNTKWPKRKSMGLTSDCLHCGEPLNDYRLTFCSLCCSTKYKRAQYISLWKQGIISGITGNGDLSKHIRNWLLEQCSNKCQLCSWNKINSYTQKVPLEIDHIDGNHINNIPDNLRVICPNCHSLTATYKGANKGKGRKHRRERYHKDK